MMETAEFQQRTGDGPMRGRSKIVQVDNALTAFHAVPADRPGTALIALKAVVRQCEAYVQHKEGKGEGQRLAGVSELQQQAGDGQAKFRTLAAFNELVAEIDRLLERGANPDTDDRALAAAAQEVSRGIPPDDFHAMMEGQVRTLGALSGDPDLPAETRGIIGELMAAAQRVTRMQVPMNGMPGMKITAGEGDSAEFTFNVDAQARGGSSFLQGHLAHELTHVAAHQAFGSSPVMELVEAGATPEEVRALATERKQTLLELQQALRNDPAFNDFQESMLSEKLVYGAQPQKLEQYASGFARAGKITEEQRARLVAYGQAAGDASGALVEYDTVLNQMLVYLHRWGISQDNPFYVRLRAAAQAASDRRNQARSRRGAGPPAPDPAPDRAP
ncbi:hypothetical protein HCN52_01150 [Streptomyces bohaiensis]|uniref:DUF4157 domain-containing protein n=2 Tax=Streptomyces bohaiensis TaxID=1431344 RepID=A0ABX1C8C0_9ACTN|nr:hypothetical protein [Streptomyces bohaiensis]NJQ13587.1 hypothetical protein [Streptomyces bohaiensis]